MSITSLDGEGWALLILNTAGGMDTLVQRFSGLCHIQSMIGYNLWKERHEAPFEVLIRFTAAWGNEKGIASAGTLSCPRFYWTISPRDVCHAPEVTGRPPQAHFSKQILPASRHQGLCQTLIVIGSARILDEPPPLCLVIRALSKFPEHKRGLGDLRIKIAYRHSDHLQS